MENTNNNIETTSTAPKGMIEKVSTKKSDKKWKQRDLVANTKAASNPSVWLAEKNREMAERQAKTAL